MFVGFVQLGNTLKGIFAVEDSSGLATWADSTPSFSVYGPNGLIAGSAASAAQLGSYPGIYEYTINATANNGYASGDMYRVLITFTVGGTQSAETQEFSVV